MRCGGVAHRRCRRDGDGEPRHGGVGVRSPVVVAVSVMGGLQFGDQLPAQCVGERRVGRDGVVSASAARRRDRSMTSLMTGLLRVVARRLRIAGLGADQQRLGGVHRCVRGGGDLLDRQPVEVAQRQRRAMVGRQLRPARRARASPRSDRCCRSASAVPRTVRRAPRVARPSRRQWSISLWRAVPISQRHRSASAVPASWQRRDRGQERLGGQVLGRGRVGAAPDQIAVHVAAGASYSARNSACRSRSLIGHRRIVLTSPNLVTSASVLRRAGCSIGRSRSVTLVDRTGVRYGRGMGFNNPSCRGASWRQRCRAGASGDGRAPGLAVVERRRRRAGVEPQAPAVPAARDRRRPGR